MSSDDASPKKPMVSSSANRPASLSLLRSFQSLIPQDALRAISLPYCGRERGGDTACTPQSLSRAASAATRLGTMGSAEAWEGSGRGVADGVSLLLDGERSLGGWSSESHGTVEIAGSATDCPDLGWVMKRVTTDGRFEFDIQTPRLPNQCTVEQMADALGLQTEEDGCEHQQTPTPSPEPQCGTGAGSSPVLSKRRTLPPISNEWVAPKMAIVILIVGTRGDVQPFLALGIALKGYGHRVRLATHETYRQWVESYSLEFFPLGGDPKVLSEYIVRNRGILPSNIGDVTAQRQQLTDIIVSTWPACTMPDTKGNNQPFTAEAIISNPPAYGHVHCAEKLGIPLHIFFTMPWSPTKAFPHPLAAIANDHEWQSAGYRNKLSYYAVEDLVWAGNYDIINKFREKVLGLEPIRFGEQGAHMLHSLKVPMTFCWSPSLVPKPDDWGSNIDVVGFFFLNESQHTQYEPPPELKAFLEAGPPPIYIGFGSLIVDNPEEVTRIIVKASLRAGVRVLLSRGWGGLGDGVDIPNIMLLDSCPHDWLFLRCSAVVHHGGAGTTAAGLIAGCPTTVIPFFGDQAFWGEACHRAGVAAPPIPIDNLSTKKLTAAFEFMQRPEVKEASRALAAQMALEDGVKEGMKSFHRQMSRFKKNFDDYEPVEWYVPKTYVVGGVYGGAGAMLYEATGAIQGLFNDVYKTAANAGWKHSFQESFESSHTNSLAAGEIMLLLARQLGNRWVLGAEDRGAWRSQRIPAH